MRGSGRGFTLLEVLVALGIFALVAGTVLTLSARSLQQAAQLEEKTLAMWVAENLLVELQLQTQAPSVGQEQGMEPLAGRDFYWLREVSVSSEPSMLRVELWVALSAGNEAHIQEHSRLHWLGFVEAQP